LQFAVSTLFLGDLPESGTGPNLPKVCIGDGAWLSFV